jgi:hypothetical protein
VRQALMLALRLWPRLPAAAVERCPLLPSAPAAGAFTGAPHDAAAAAAAAAGFFRKPHLEALLPVLLATTQSHPRLHSLWPTLLALLLPGFTADKVRVWALKGWGLSVILTVGLCLFAAHLSVRPSIGLPACLPARVPPSSLRSSHLSVRPSIRLSVFL